MKNFVVVPLEKGFFGEFCSLLSEASSIKIEWMDLEKLKKIEGKAKQLTDEIKLETKLDTEDFFNFEFFDENCEEVLWTGFILKKVESSSLGYTRVEFESKYDSSDFWGVEFKTIPKEGEDVLDCYDILMEI